MANLIQATVYQIDGAPLSSPINIDFQTSNIVIREASINIAAVNSAIQYYNVPNNALSVKTYYVSETIANLVSDANVGTVTQVQATVIEVNKDPQLDSIQYSFPANEILVGEVIGSTTGINSTITFKNDVYSVAETQATLLAAVNDLSDFVLNKGGVPSFQANTLANLPMPGSAGRMFVSTDTYAFYRDNGIGWDLMGGPGIGTVTGSGVATQVAFWNGTSVISGSSNLFWDGVNARLGIGTASPAQQLDVAGSARIQTIANATTDTDRFLVSDSGVIKYRTGAEVLSDIGAPAGTGTTNYLVKWTGTTALGNSLVFDNGTSVGINTASPSATYKLDVSGNAQIINPLATTTLRLGNGAIYTGTLDFGNSYISQTSGPLLTIQSNATLDLSTNFATRLRVTMAGRVLIGTTTESTYELDVVGDIRSTLDANINGLTVGKGGGSVATNTAVGVQAINATATGGNNTGFGYVAFQSLTSGINNTAVGSNTLKTNSTANYNTGIGSDVLQATSTGGFNTAVGSSALYLNSTGAYNTMIGMQSGYNVTGNYNTGLGMLAARGITSGIYNTFIGANDASYAGSGITTGNYNVIIGSNLSGLSASLSNTIILADGQGNQRLYINSSGNVGLGGGTADATYKMTVGGIFQFVTGSSFFGMSSGNLTLNNWGAYINNQSTSFSFLGQIAGANIGSFTGSSTAVTINSITNLPLRFLTNNTEVGRFFANGNFAIGTTTDAGYKLDVNGTFRAQSINTALSAGTQYVNFASANALFNTNSSSYSFAFWNGSNSFTIASDKVATLRRFDFLGQSTDPVAGLYGTYFNTTDNQLKTYTSAGWKFIPFEDSNHNYITSGGGYFGNTTTDASAILSATSTTKGFLPPRMTNAQMVAIGTPASGLMVYDTTNNKLNVYDGTNWVAVH